MTPGSYTELFFLDEATALSAGHRPCARCQHARCQEFLRAWGAAHHGSARTGEVDQRLKQERTPSARPLVADLASLPSGVFVGDDRGSWLVLDGKLHPWSFEGYGEPAPLEGSGFRLLTPVSTVEVMRRGFRPGVHPSAARNA